MIKFTPETCSAVLQVHRPSSIIDMLGEQMAADGFQEKGEFHVTILPELDRAHIDPEKVERYQIALSEGCIGDVRFVKNSIWRIRKPKTVGEQAFDRESIVIGVESRSVTALLTHMTLMHLTPPQPFLHVTLATRGDEPYASRGIGIRTWDAFMGLLPERYPAP